MATLVDSLLSSKLKNTMDGDQFGENDESAPPVLTAKKPPMGYRKVEEGQQTYSLSASKDRPDIPESNLTAHLPAANAENVNAHDYPRSKQGHHNAAIAKGMTDSSPADSTGTPMLTESSTMSLQEMFENDELIAPGNADYSHGAHPGRQASQEQDGEDQWFSGDGGMLEKDDHPSSTPPLSLYAGTSDKYTSGPPSTIPQSSNPSSVASSGMNTPVSYVSQNTGILSTGEGPPSSIGSNTTSSVPRNKPLLYSAISSLENCNASSFRDLSKRVRPRRDFSKLGSPQPAALIPPQTTTSKTKADVSRTLLAVDSHDILSRKNQNKTTSNKESTASTRATPTASNRKATLEKESARMKGAQGRPAKDTMTSLRTVSATKTSTKSSKSRKVSINKDGLSKKPIEMFRPSCDAYTPRIEKKRFEYRKAEMRTPVQNMASPMGTLSRPNFRDALRRVAMIIHQHIAKIERRFEVGGAEKDEQGLFRKSMRETFSEDAYCTPIFKCTMVRIPMARPGMVYGLRKIKTKPTIPSEEEIYEFAHQLFKAVQLSSECSIVCLIYVERLMEVAKVPLLANTWRPIFMCGLLLASKVWQDLSSWNIEFASVYPQYSLGAINRLELNFLRSVKWDLYISTSLYAKYYFALRSLVEKVDFRQRYNRMVGGVDSVAQVEAMKISKRTEQFKEEAILQLSRSM